MTAKVIIFDFDGTIADTLDALVSITNRLAVEFGYKPIAQEELALFKTLNSRQIIKHSGISIFQLPFLVRKVKAELNKEIRTLSFIPGIKEVLIELKNQGNSLGIITSNSKENVITFLSEKNLQYLFDFIYSGTKLFGKSKVINKFLKQENIKPEAAIYVGDEIRDIEAARRSEIKVIAVSWGFNSEQVLAEQNPDYLIQNPAELIDAIRELGEQMV